MIVVDAVANRESEQKEAELSLWAAAGMSEGVAAYEDIKASARNEFRNQWITPHSLSTSDRRRESAVHVFMKRWAVLDQQSRRRAAKAIVAKKAAASPESQTLVILLDDDSPPVSIADPEESRGSASREASADRKQSWM